jgi:arylsulfatase A-like enzyme
MENIKLMGNKIKIILISVFVLAGTFLVWRYFFAPSSSTYSRFNGPIGPKSRPNIVLIIVDALRADKLNCYGFPGEISPEIDAMAREGVLFENAISQCSWTRPSIGSMLTALHPRSIGIYKEKYDILHDKYLTLAEILKANGYRTLGITANPNINKIFNFHQGFDDYQDSRVIWKWMKKEPDKKKFSDDAHLARSKEIFKTILQKVKSCGPEPLYIQINIMEVHSPYLVRDEYKEAFKDHPVRKVNVRYSQEKLENLVRWTLGAVRQVSYDIGDFVTQLCALPGMKNTLFVITSDHGQGLDDHPDVYGSQAHGNLLYESHLLVPLIFYHPGAPRKIFASHRVKTRVRLLDLMPTILDYVGIKMSKNHKIHGTSLINLITHSGEKPALPQVFIAETNWRNVNKIALYSDNWKYFENRDNWKDVNKRELQPVGLTENGKRTDKISDEVELSKKMKAFLFQWEKQYKRTKPTFPRGKLSRKEIEQLKSLGYLK